MIVSIETFVDNFVIDHGYTKEHLENMSTDMVADLEAALDDEGITTLSREEILDLLTKAIK